MSGIARLMDEVAPGTPRSELSASLQRLADARSYLDVDPARPYLDRDQPGILVFARPIDGERALLVIDDGRQLLGATGAFGALPRLGSAVRLAARRGTRTFAWRLAVDEELPLPIGVRFDRAAAAPGDRRWIRTLRDALEEISAIEALRRDALASRRRDLPALQHVPLAHELVRQRVASIGRDAEREAGAASGARFEMVVSEKLASVRATLPDVHERVRRIRAANDAVRDELQRIENAYGESRARTVSACTALGWLDAFERAPFAVDGLDAPLTSLDDPAYADDVVRTVVLLARAFTRTRDRIAV